MIMINAEDNENVMIQSMADLREGVAWRSIPPLFKSEQNYFYGEVHTNIYEEYSHLGSIPTIMTHL